MATRKPLVLVAGQLQELSSTDSLANAAPYATPHLLPITSSTTWTAPRAGVVITRQMGAGGGGSGDSSGSGCGTGGGSAAWGEKRWNVTEGQEFTISLGAAGLGGTNAPGSDGGATTITSNGVTVTTPGGKGGLYSATPVALTSPAGAAPTNVDFGAAGAKSGDTVAASAAYTGGAGVNLYAQPGNPTRSGDALNSNTATGGGSTTYPSANVSVASGAQSGGAGFLGPSGVATGTSTGAPGPGLFSTSAPTGQATDLYATQGPWGIWPTGPGNGAFQSLCGGGGDAGTSIARAGGAFSGGGACRSTGAGGNGGYGGGGGAGRTKGGDGGQGYVVIEFIPAE